MIDYLNQNKHTLIGGALMGLVCALVGFSVFHWQYWVILVTTSVWYATKPNQ